MTTASDRPYRMSFTTGGLFLNESVEVARLHRDGETWSDTGKRALEQGTTTLPKSASNSRSLREITNRLRTLTEEERRFLCEHADRTDQQALLWLAACRAYRFVGEFAQDVVRDRYLSYQLELPLSAFDIALENKAEWDDGIASLSRSTRSKLRQILFRIMREAGILSQDNRIQASILSTQLKQIINDNNPGELAYFPSTSVDGA
ncbi:DUF1819 family protein [uncultured Sulfitobacter sp.]|uniref:DUF1819 family protein n=1 Tax=uncultured Sulfitobacter sp. TaxID=191468 RepID=UPI00262AF3F7|nr:DUF1819 family protein [uncultured Sulfitobacter sp.]